MGNPDGDLYPPGQVLAMSDSIMSCSPCLHKSSPFFTIMLFLPLLAMCFSPKHFIMSMYN